MDLKQLESFVHIAEMGSFTRASAFLSVAQPALSRQVRRLEIELRQTLLYRNGRGVSVTDAGKRLLDHARGILVQVDRAKQDLAENRGAPRGRVVVGMPPSVGRAFAAPLVSTFQSRFAKATISIVEGLTTYILEWLAMGRVDIGLVYNPVPSPHVEATPLLEEQLYLIGPAVQHSKPQRVGKPVALSQVPNHRLIIPSRPHAMRMFVETQLANAGLRLDVGLEIDGVPAILDLVAEGHGFAVLPLNAIRGNKWERPCLARPIHKPKLASVLALATASQRPITPLSQRVIELIREAAPKHLSSERGLRVGSA